MITPESNRLFGFYSSYEELETLFNQALKRIDEKKLEPNQQAFFDNIKVDINTIFPYPELLENILKTFEELSYQTDTGGMFDKQRLKISDDQRNLFSFGLAALGLQRVPEYYSAEIASVFSAGFGPSSDPTVVPGIVDPNLVQTTKLPGDRVFYWAVIEGKEYSLIQQQKGSQYILNHNPNAKLITDSGMPHAVPISFKDVKLAFTSTNKKSYVELPRQGGKSPAVDLYIPIDLFAEKVQERIASAMPLILAAQYFMQAGIQVRISMTRAYIKKKPRTAQYTSYFSAVQIKDFSDPIDWSRIMTMRTIFNIGLRSSVMAALVMNEANKTIGNNYKMLDNSAVNQANVDVITYNYPSLYQEEFGRFKNWMFEQSQSGKISVPLVDKPLMISMDTKGLLKAKIGRSDIEQKSLVFKTVENKFYLLLDVVNMYFNKKTDEVIKQISERLREQGISNYDQKTYLISIAGQLYRDSYPIDGVFASAPEEIESSDQKYKAIISKISDYFND